jgi:hypothetical protein
VCWKESTRALFPAGRRAVVLLLVAQSRVHQLEGNIHTRIRELELDTLLRNIAQRIGTAALVLLSERVWVTFAGVGEVKVPGAVQHIHLPRLSTQPYYTSIQQKHTHVCKKIDWLLLRVHRCCRNEEGGCLVNQEMN